MRIKYVALTIPRRWLQFNLRTVLALMLIVALGIGGKYELERATIRRLALDGYSPVSLVNESRWMIGNKKFSEFYQGRLYYFVSAQQRGEFLKAPDKFALTASGFDVVLVKNVGREEYGFRRFGYNYRGKLYLFSTQSSMHEFCNSPTAYAEFAAEWAKGKY